MSLFYHNKNLNGEDIGIVCQTRALEFTLGHKENYYMIRKVLVYES